MPSKKAESSSKATTKTTSEETSDETFSEGSKKRTGSKISGYGTGTGAQQDVLSSEIGRPPIYKRIACIRYTRPMMPNNGCWGMYGSPYNCPYGYDPYYGGFPPGQSGMSTRALIIPPRPKNLYRPAREEDFVTSLHIVDPCSGGDAPKHIYHAPPPPPRPHPPPKPKVDRKKIIKKYLHDAKVKPPPKKKKPKEKKKSHPPKKEEKKPPPPPPKEEKKPPPPPPKEEKKPPPPPPKEEPKPPPPPPPKPKTISESSKSSVKTDPNVNFKQNDEREHHFYSDVARRDSSYDAVTKAAKNIKHNYAEAVAPQRRNQ